MKRFTLFQSLLWIVLSTLVVTPSAYAGIRFLQKKRQEHLTAAQYYIRSIIQTSGAKRALNTAFFAERLGLSADMPQNIYRFDIKLAEKKLQDTALFKEVKVKKLYPDTLYIEYEMRIPIAKLGEYENVAIDDEEMVFPLTPFFANRKIPEIYLGEVSNAISYNRPLHHPKLAVALEIKSVVDNTIKDKAIEKIDVVNIDSGSCGQREAVIVLKDPKGKHFLRLQTKDLHKELENYLSLQHILDKGDKVIDLRIENLAYIDRVANE